MNDIVIRALQAALKDAGEKINRAIRNAPTHAMDGRPRDAAVAAIAALQSALNAYDAIAAELEFAQRAKVQAFNAANAGGRP